MRGSVDPKAAQQRYWLPGRVGYVRGRRRGRGKSPANVGTLGLQHDFDALAHGHRPAINPRRLILPVARRYQQQWIIEHVNRLDDPCADDVAGLVDLHFDRAAVLSLGRGERER